MITGELNNIVLLGASLVCAEYLYRFLVALTELRFRSRHYPIQNRFPTILEYSFYQNVVALIVSVVLLGVAVAHDWKAVLLTTAQLSLVYLPLRRWNYQHSLVDDAKWIRGGKGIDYATGMASNYFHGYINLQLAERETNIPGIRERLQDYANSQNVCVPVKRLFILVPDSLHCKPSFKEPGKLEFANDVVSEPINRAGCIRRPFKTSVYRMKDEETDTFWYAAMEGATPLQSFSESMTDQLTSTWVMTKMKREIAFQFYRTLKRISESPRFQQSPAFDLIYYNDVAADGTPTPISEVVKARIRELIKRGHD